MLRYYQVKFECKRKRNSSSGIRAKFVLRLCLEDIFRETLNQEFYTECVMSMNVLADNSEQAEEADDDEKRISKSKSKENGVFARPLDEDDQLPPSGSSVYRSISSQLRLIYVQLNSLCMNLGLNNPDSSHKSHPENHNSQNDSTPRKVRPVTQVPAADLKQQRIQKQLRQWFWWRYGSQKDLIDSLNSYILEQLLFPQFPISSDRAQVSQSFYFRSC